MPAALLLKQNPQNAPPQASFFSDQTMDFDSFHSLNLLGFNLSELHAACLP